MRRNGPAQASEHWDCLDCGSGIDVRCHFVHEFAGMPQSQVFRGTASLAPDASAVKAILKLKKILHIATHFSLAALEAQHLKGKREWDIGDFYDFEMERVKDECNIVGLTLSFTELNPDRA
jgi:hypothetical protein